MESTPVPLFIPIIMSGLKQIYAGSDGNIYKLKSNLTLIKLTDQVRDKTIPIEKQEKRVNLKIYSDDGDYINVKFSVGYLVCGAFKGWKKHLHTVVYRDGNRQNTIPDNLEWTTIKFEKVRNIIAILNLEGEDYEN